MEKTTTKFYTMLIKALNGEEIDSLDIGITSKRILSRLVSLMNKEENKMIKESILKMDRLNIEIGRRILREQEKKITLEKIKSEVNNI